ncbi:MAG: SMC family ATPase [Deinococcales bacterium]
MRPLRLELSGFMPFLERQELSFEELSLFAICGPTGSGKSTLLDAIIYALYGQTPRLGKQGLVELINPKSDKLVVLFEFSVKDGIYRIVRSLNRKRSGAELRLYHQDDSAVWRQLPEVTSAEISAKLEKLIGLGYEDFVRAVLLPQGAFDSFLRGKPKERRDLLIKLLDLERIPIMMGIASDKAKQALNRLNFIADELTRLAPISQEAIEALAEEKLNLKDESASLELKLASLRQELQDLEALRKLFEDRGKQLNQLSGLEAQDEAVQQKRARLSTATQAQPLQQPWADLQELKGDLDKTLKEKLKQIEALSLKQLALDKAEGFLVELKERRERRLGEIDEGLERLATLTSDLNQLKALGGHLNLAKYHEATNPWHYSPQAWQELQQRQNQAEKLESFYEQKITLLSQQGKQLQQLQKHQQDSLKQLKEGHEQNLKETQKQLEKLQKVLQEVTTQQGQAKAQVSRLEQDLKQRLEEGKEARESFDHADKVYQEAEIRDRAAALRQHLHDGDSCPVCGQPITHLPATSGLEDLKALQKAKELASKRLEKSRDDYKQCQHQLQLWQDKLKEFTERQETLSQEMQEQEAKCYQLQQQQQARLATLEKEHQATLARAQKQAEEELGHFSQRISLLEEDLGLPQEAKVNLSSQLKAEREGLLAHFAHSIKEKSQGLDPETAPASLRQEKAKLNEALEKAQKTQQDSQQSYQQVQQSVAILDNRSQDQQKQLDKVQKSFDSKLRGAGFATVLDLEKALLSESLQQKLQEEIQHFEKQKSDLLLKLTNLEQALRLKTSAESFDAAGFSA